MVQIPTELMGALVVVGAIVGYFTVAYRSARDLLRATLAELERRGTEHTRTEVIYELRWLLLGCLVWPVMTVFSRWKQR